MWTFLHSLRKNRRLLADFVVRDLKGRYVGSSMGFFWSVIFPIINLVVYMFVFRLIINVRFEDKASPKDVAVWMLAGIIVWAAFAETLARTTNSLVENSNLIQKVVFPAEVLPVYLTVSSLINMSIGLPIVMAGVAYFAYFDTTPIETASLFAQDVHIVVEHRDMGLGFSLIALPLLMAVQGVFTIGIGCLFATLNLFLRDVHHLIGVLTTVWMYATPIFYPAAMVEQRNDGKYAWLLDINPMHWLISCYRDILVFGDWPDWMLLNRFAFVAAILFCLGTLFFSSQKRNFPDLL